MFDYAELGFKSIEKAEKFINGANQLWYLWIRSEDTITMYFFADIIEKLYKEKYITKNDLYELSEQEIINIIKNCPDKKLSNLFKEFMKCNTFVDCEEYRKDKFIVEGIKMLEEAINENASIDLIVIREGMDLSNLISNVIPKNNIDSGMKSKNIIDAISKIKSITVTEKVFDTLTDVVSPQGVLAVINKRGIINQATENNNASEIGDKIKETENVKIDTTADYILALDGIQDPGNLGTIIRTADSANLKQIIVSKNTVDAYSPKVIRSTMGAIYRVNIIGVENLEVILKNLQKDGFKVVVTSLDTNNSIYDISYNKSIVVIGNEANGVSKEVQELADERVKIPMLGKTESLNAAVATGIMIYEYVRRKNETSSTKS